MPYELAMNSVTHNLHSRVHNNAVLEHKENQITHKTGCNMFNKRKFILIGMQSNLFK